MRQFAVCRNPRPSGRRAPFLVSLQTDVIDLSTRLVAPLVRPDYFGEPIKRLNPIFEVQSALLVFSPTEMTAVRANDLPASVDDLRAHRDAIVAALDMLFTGI